MEKDNSPKIYKAAGTQSKVNEYARQRIIEHLGLYNFDKEDIDRFCAACFSEVVPDEISRFLSNIEQLPNAEPGDTPDSLLSMFLDFIGENFELPPDVELPPLFEDMPPLAELPPDIEPPCDD